MSPYDDAHLGRRSVVARLQPFSPRRYCPKPYRSDRSGVAARLLLTGSPATSPWGRQGPVGHAMEPIAGHADVEWLVAAGSIRPARAL